MDGGVIIAQNEEDDDEAESKFYLFVSEVLGCKIISNVKDSETYTQRVEKLRSTYESKEKNRQGAELEGLSFKWIRNKNQATALAPFFIENVDSSYISHTEIQEGRAINEHEWSDKLPEILKKEFTYAVETDLYEKLDIAGVYQKDTVIGYALFEFDNSLNGKYATLSDIVVSQNHRNKKVAEKLVGWVLPQLKAQGINQLFAESNEENHPAHALLEKIGFKQISKVFRMEL